MVLSLVELPLPDVDVLVDVGLDSLTEDRLVLPSLVLLSLSLPSLLLELNDNSDSLVLLWEDSLLAESLDEEDTDVDEPLLLLPLLDDDTEEEEEPLLLLKELLLLPLEEDFPEEEEDELDDDELVSSRPHECVTYRSPHTSSVTNKTGAPLPMTVRSSGAR